MYCLRSSTGRLIVNQPPGRRSSGGLVVNFPFFCIDIAFGLVVECRTA